jgi:hypothetical protein
MVRYIGFAHACSEGHTEKECDCEWEKLEPWDGKCRKLKSRKESKMLKVHSRRTIYTLSLDDLKEMVAKELSVDKEEVRLSFIMQVQDDRFGPPGYPDVGSIEVVVESK